MTQLKEPRKKKASRPLDVAQKAQKRKKTSKTGPLEEEEDIPSSKELMMNYVEREETIKAIRLEKLEDWYIWQLKEKLDNAIDDSWKRYPTAPPGSDAKKVYATIEIDTKGNLFHCTVRNQNPDNKTVFKDLDKNFDFGRTFGTKQNDHIISRGYLGDATKRTHAIGHTLAKEIGKTQWEYPMIFRFNHQEYESVLNVDRMTPKIEATPVPTGKTISESYTEVENTWPLLDSVKDNVTSKKIEDFCKCYSLFTTDISFGITIGDDRIMTSSSYYPQPTTTVYIPSTTYKPISKKWANVASIYSYSLEKFSKRIYAIYHKKTTTVYQFDKKFREWNQVSKSDCPDLDVPISEFLGNTNTEDKKIRELYYRLRREGNITNPPEKISLPYTIKQERKKSLIRRFSGLLPYEPEIFDTQKRAVYEIVDDVYKEIDQASGEEVQFPYAIEVVAIPFSELHLKDYGNTGQASVIAVTAINYSVSPLGINIDGSDADFTGFGAHANKFIYEAFNHYGFIFESDENTQDTKIPCVFAINLITPCPTYMSEGKSDIDINPYRDGIIAAAKSIANKVRTFKSAKIETPDLEEQREERDAKRTQRNEERAEKESEREEKRALRAAERRRKEQEKAKKKEEKKQSKNVREVVNMEIQARYEKFKRGEKFEEDTLLNDVWYMLLPQFKKYKSIPKEDRGIRNESRPAVKKYIGEMCKDLGVKRSDIGIFAGIRARMYYMGKDYPVGFDEIETLANYGVAVIFIEKGGMVQVMNRFAEQYGIALVNSEGHLTEYAQELSELATKKGARVGIVTDLDLNGVLIATKVKGAAWLGIDKRTIERFNIPMPDPKTGLYPESETREMVVPYESKKKPIEKEKLYKLQQEDPRFGPDRIDIDWLWTGEEDYYDEDKKKWKKKVVGNKIEINAVKVDLGSEGLWNYILERMAEEWPTCDYTRVISTDSELIPPKPPTIDDFSYDSDVVDGINDYIKIKAAHTSEDKKDKIEEELKDFPSFQIVDDLKYEKKLEFEESVLKDKEIEDIHSTARPILAELEASIIEKVRPKQEEIDELQQQIDELQEEIDDIASEDVEEAERERIIPALKQLAQEKGYDGIGDIADELKDESAEGSQNQQGAGAPPGGGTT